MLEILKYLSVEIAIGTIRELLGFRKTETALVACETKLTTCQSWNKFYKTALIVFVIFTLPYVISRGDRIT